MPKKGYKPAQEYHEGDEIPEGYLSAELSNGKKILRKEPKTGAKRKQHIRHKEGGGYYKTNKMMKNFYEGIGIPANTNGRPSKNGIMATESNPHGAGKPLRFSTPNKLDMAFSGALRKMATKGGIMTRKSVLIEMGMSNKTFLEYKSRPGYDELCERIDDLAEVYLLEQALTDRNPNAIPLLKMYHDRAEKQSIEITAKSPVEKMTDEELDKLIGDVVEAEVIDVTDE